MTALLESTLEFPTVLFTPALLVTVVFWLLVMTGTADHDSFGSSADSGSGALGLGGVPVTVAASLLITIGWFTCLTGSALLAGTEPPGSLRHVLRSAVLVAALLVAWWTTRALVRPLTKLFPDRPGPSRQDFLGLTCTIRTGRVDESFGQAEVTADDGSTAVVQVRRIGTDVLGPGSTGLLYAYEEAGEFFWVAPYDKALDPRG